MLASTSTEQEHHPSDSPNLLKHLREALRSSALASGPSAPRGTIRLHLVISQPTPARNLYPLAHVQPSRSANPSSSKQLVLQHPVQGFEEHIFLTATWTAEGASASTSSTQVLTSESVVIYALECFLYTIPTAKAALLYVSKLDSTGYGPHTPRYANPAEASHWLDVALREEAGSTTAPPHAAPSPATSSSLSRVLTQAFMHHFASLAHWKAGIAVPLPTSIQHVSIHILARAQATYLFPGSPKVSSKRVLSDAALINWWRSCVGGVVRAVRESSIGDAAMDVRPYYMIPGYSRLDSHPLVPLAQASHPEAATGWIYGHPYSRTARPDVPPLPLHLSTIATDLEESVATLIPHFADDPKSRFINELARDAHERVLIDRPRGKVVEGEDGAGDGMPARKRLRLDEGEKTAQAIAESLEESDPPSSQTRVGENVDSQITLAPSSPSPAHAEASLPSDTSHVGDDALPPHLRLSPHTLRSLAAERAALDAVPPNEFWERMGYRQECCAGNAVGAFVVGFTAKSFLKDDTAATTTVSSPPVGSVAPPSMQALALPNPTLPDLVLRHLLRDACDWSTRESAAQLTRAWDEGVRKALIRKGGIAVRNDGASTDEESVGKGVVWADVQLCGPTVRQLDRARELREEATREGRSIVLSVSAANSEEEKPKVNLLSVKRKKKPAA